MGQSCNRHQTEPPMLSANRDRTHKQVRRIDNLLHRLEARLAERPQGDLAYGPTLRWAYWLAFPDGVPLLMSAAAYGSDNRVINLGTSVSIISTKDVTQFVLGLELDELKAFADGIESWLRVPQYRRIVDAIRERTRSITPRTDDKTAMRADN